MNLRAVGLVAGKELRETLRDRRTLAVMVLFPLVVYPLLSLLTTQFLASRATRTAAAASRVIVVGTPASASLVRTRLAASGAGLEVVPGTGSPVADVMAGRADAAVEVAGGRDGAPPSARIAFDETREASREARERIAAALTEPSRGCAAFTVSSRGIAARDAIGGYVLAKVLPLVVVMMVMLGAFYPAIDIAAGERERGTLETTLSAPVERSALLGGKVLAVAALAALTGLLNLASLSLTVIEGARVVASHAPFSVPWGRLSAALVVVPPAAFLFASAMVAIGTVARSYKEAQTLLTPIYILCMAPSLTAALADFELQGGAVFFPGVNVTLLARDLVLGRAHVVTTALVFASTVVYGLAALSLATRLYDSERLLEAAEPGLRLGAWIRRLLRRDGGHPEDRPPTAGDALALYAMAWVVLVLLAEVQARNLPLGLLLFEWGGLGGLTIAYARGTGRSLGTVLRLRAPSASALAGGIAIGLSAWLVVGLVVDWIAPAPKAVVDELRRLIAPPGKDRTLAVTLFLTALSPAICEEALFRGPILRGLRERLRPAGAAIITGILFGLYHGDLWRFLPAGILGTLLSVIALAGDSILPAMAAHFLNNAILVVLTRYDLDQLDALAPRTKAILGGMASGVLGFGLVLLARTRARRVM